jgi:maleylpyruvate isomerase
MILHNYFRSSTSTRLRAALNLKGLDYDYAAYPLKERAHKTPEFLKKNPAGLVPVLQLDDGTVLPQSLAIIEYLDETHPEPPLLPAEPLLRAKARAYALMIACEVHPLNTLRVLQHLAAGHGADRIAQKAWMTHWITETFTALETLLADSPATGTYCIGETPGIADICLYAQVFNNTRCGIPLETWPTVARIFTALDALEPFRRAAPQAQPDAD